VGIFDKDTYQSLATILGGVASVAGLFAFTRPALTSSDLDEASVSSLKSIAETSEQLLALEKVREKKKEEIGNLELQKKEMELLVKKAATALFLREQHDHHQKIIISEVGKSEA